MPNKLKFFSLWPSKIDHALKSSAENINLRAYFTLCWCVPAIMTLLPLSSGFHYISIPYVIDCALYIAVMIIGFWCLFRIDEKDQLLALRYFICNYPIFYLICYVVIKSVPFVFLLTLYFFNSGVVGYRDYFVKTYINSNFIYYAEMATNLILHISIFYIICTRYRRFKLLIE
jgi:hypothetical protein